MWQATQKLYQKDAPAENCPSQKRKYLWPGQFPASVSPAMAMQAQIARRKERRLGLPLLAACTFILELMSVKVMLAQLLKHSRLYFWQKKICAEFQPQRLQNFFFIPTFLLEHTALGWSLSALGASVLALETIPFPGIQDDLCH